MLPDAIYLDPLPHFPAAQAYGIEGKLLGKPIPGAWIKASFTWQSGPSTPFEDNPLSAK